jgi:hypothetical protein
MAGSITTTDCSLEAAPGEPLHDRAAALTALAALYQGEKTDASYIFNTAMALMGLAVAYLVFAIPSVRSLSTGPYACIFLLLLPVPLWIVVAFHSLITLNAMSHGVSVRIIEDELFDASELPTCRTLVGPEGRELVGSAAGDKIMDIGKSQPIHKLVTWFVYLGVGLLVLGFTWYAVFSAAETIKHVKHWPNVTPKQILWVASIIYSLMLLMVARSWNVGLSMIKRGRKAIEVHVKRFGNRTIHPGKSADSINNLPSPPSPPPAHLPMPTES